jgi:hypothetical protein
MGEMRGQDITTKLDDEIAAHAAHRQRLAEDRAAWDAEQHKLHEQMNIATLQRQRQDQDGGGITANADTDRKCNQAREKLQAELAQLADQQNQVQSRKEQLAAEEKALVELWQQRKVDLQRDQDREEQSMQLAQRALTQQKLRAQQNADAEHDLLQQQQAELVAGHQQTLESMRATQQQQLLQMRQISEREFETVRGQMLAAQARERQEMEHTLSELQKQHASIQQKLSGAAMQSPLGSPTRSDAVQERDKESNQAAVNSLTSLLTSSRLEVRNTILDSDLGCR